ncbi:hypothetical protein ABJ763_001587 [Escherichia coli]|uniref:hypothetical protein n=1 Tax=Enterobacter TaxID=547 RepID=UPI0007504DD7|nr:MULTISPECIES: hypothetical protein [Enterobacter]EJE8631276.1 hypothetical protein [Escherichia coli]KUQ38179.1 hypothetical protein AWI16_21850 [Enterobacter ludwigii]KZP56774.1 hypothetical protein A3N37_23450 [Enterobacter ludwigii]MBX9031990.1 hypothetical protein [Enterobacter ludwigii]RUN95780.1 hypothetical protein EKN26_18695 [Enterobacter bugandensis]
MFAEIKDNYSLGGYRKVAITSFRRVENKNLIYSDREYELTLANGTIIKNVLRKEEWELLESNSIKVIE